ncbi:WSC domain protein [Aspergillus eucalypticola CBS 122712]|uniref:WSC domain protein n=1 Tax=Aspergillus eucalypticola (strain CBS 122712 / IBT 29274) TaxID=1448314 RepID=A0A317V7R2_ASPEC|nr:WSC domain protein [Aspergillus eucalypticola CBS 122712]PWY69459.1 WSC domain protein [Aspergillus eucalypticola CBS 122712]
MWNRYIAALLLLTSGSNVLAKQRTTDEFTFSCDPLTTQLSDPIVAPGKPSTHTHVVTGGTAFQRTMNESTAQNAKGTTCEVDIDRSNYWVPQLYHRMRNGSFELVEYQSSVGIALDFIESPGSLVEDRKELANELGRLIPLAPPKGLRMLAGDPSLRTYNDSNWSQRAISHMCIGKDGSSNETKGLPQQPCEMLRSQVFMPSCWDGENLDSSDHKSHMAYPDIGDYNKGVCPKSHPVAIYSIFLEFFFNTAPHPDYKNWIYATGDKTGYGLHGDFMYGWTDQVALQQAIDTCTGPQGLTDPDCSITRNQTRDLAPMPQPLDVPAPKDNIGQHGPVNRLPGHRNWATKYDNSTLHG